MGHRIEIQRRGQREEGKKLNNSVQPKTSVISINYYTGYIQSKDSQQRINAYHKNKVNKMKKHQTIANSNLKIKQ